MPRAAKQRVASEKSNNDGIACNAGLVGDGFDSSSSEDEEPRRTGNRAVDNSASEDEAPVRRIQGRSSGGAKRVHSLSGPTLMDSQAAAAAAAPADSDWKEVRVSYRLCASLRELADGTAVPELKLSEDAMQIYDNSEKRTENHICGGVSVIEYDSTFPVSLHVDVNGIKSGAAKSFTQSGTRGALTIRPRGQFSDARGIEVAAGNMESAQKSPFLREYKGWNLNNVNNGITFCADKLNAMVEANHPIVAYYNAALGAAGDDPICADDLIDGTNMFMAKVADVDECLASLKRTMQENLQIQNLYNVSFKLSRAYGEADEDGAIDWVDTEEACDGVQGARTGDAIMNQKRTLYMTASFKVRTLDE